MADWIDPREWIVGEAITATKLNEISESVNYLHIKPNSIVTILGSGTNLTSTSTTIAAVDDAQFTLSVEVQAGETVKLWLKCDTGHSLTTGTVVFDVLLDGTTYISSGTSTPVTQGLWNLGAPQNRACTLPALPVIVSGLSAGVHTFVLRWKVIVAGTITLYLNGSYFQFGVKVD